jgi:hypothetical protein
MRERGLKGGVHLRDRGKSIVRVLGGGFQNHSLDDLGYRRADAPGGRHGIADVLDEDGHRCFGFERKASGRHLIEHNAERVLVAPGVDLRALHLFGREVGRRPKNCRAGQAQGGIRHMCQAKVGEQGIALLVEKNVGGLDVPVNDSLPVSEIERPTHLSDDPAALCRLERATRETIGEAPRRIVGHHEVDRPILDLEILDRHDVWVTELEQETRLPLKAEDNFRVGRR